MDIKQIQHIARLARLELAEEQMEIYAQELSPIINYFDQLKEVNIEDVEPTAQVTGLENIMREDEIVPCEDLIREKALEQAAFRKGNEIKVKRIL